MLRGVCACCSGVCAGHQSAMASWAGTQVLLALANTGKMQMAWSIWYGHTILQLQYFVFMNFVTLWR